MTDAARALGVSGVKEPPRPSGAIREGQRAAEVAGQRFEPREQHGFRAIPGRVGPAAGAVRTSDGGPQVRRAT